MKRICVFCGSSPGAKPVYADAARAVGEEMVKQGIGLVYGGGNVGLMGVLADTVMKAGGEAIGVIPDGLARREVAHLGLTELKVVSSMHERKALMSELSEAFIALPGGFGTFEEFFEAVTWTQLGIYTKPCGLLNVEGFYDPLLALVNQGVSERFIRPEHAKAIVTDVEPLALINRLAAWTPVLVEKWLDRTKT